MAPKLGYVIALPRWGWVIGTGIYLDDVEAALAQIDGDRLTLDGLLFLPDGSAHWATHRAGSTADALAIGRDAGAELKAKAGETYRAKLQ